jgi:hypothetical protein
MPLSRLRLSSSFAKTGIVWASCAPYLRNTYSDQEDCQGIELEHLGIEGSPQAVLAKVFEVARFVLVVGYIYEGHETGLDRVRRFRVELSGEKSGRYRNST